MATDRYKGSRIDQSYQDGHGRYANPDDITTKSLGSGGIKSNGDSTTNNSPPKNQPENKPDFSADSIRDKETNPSTAWKDSTSPGENRQSRGNKFITALKNPRKGGAFGILTALIIGGAFGIGALLTPATMLFHLKETFLEKYNDQLTTMELRTTRVLMGQLKERAISGVCAEPIKFRCRYQTMSERQVSRLEKKTNGRIKVVGDKTITGRIKPKYLEVDVGGKITQIKAGDLLKTSATNVEVNGLLKQAYNPKYAIFADNTMKKLAGRLGLSKGQNIKPSNNVEDMENDIHRSSTGEIAIDESLGITCDKDGAGKEVCKGKDGKPLSDTEVKDMREKAALGFKEIGKEVEARKNLKNVYKDVAKNSFKGAIASVALGLGAVDSACSGYILVRTVGFAAKAIGSNQLSRYYFAIMNTIDQTKAGDGVQETMSLIGNKLTATNTSGVAGTSSVGANILYHDDTYMPLNTAGDADINSTGDIDVNETAINQKNESLRYVNGQIVQNNIMADLVGIIGKFASITNGNADDACGFVKSGWGQATLLLAGVAGALVGFLSGGTSLGAGFAAQIAVSVSIGIAIAILTPKLYDMVAGTVVTGLEEGPMFMNALVSGGGAYNALSSQNRGLGVMTTETVGQYARASQEVDKQYIAMEKLNRNPLDTSSKYTALGSVLYASAPYIKNSTNPTNTISSLLTATRIGIGTLISPAKAADESSKYTACNDMDVKSLNLAADPFCNIRYGESPSALSLDPDEVAAEMIDTGQVDETTGEAIPDSEYAQYLELCQNRSEPIGGYTEETLSKYGADRAMGKDCIVKNDGTASSSSVLSYFDSNASAVGSVDKFAKFRVYTYDKSISETLEDGYADFTTPLSGNSTENETPIVDMPPEAVADGPGWKLPAGADYSKYNCTDGTKEIDITTNTANGTKFRRCQAPGDAGYVASITSALYMKAKNDAKADGVDLVLSGPRTGLRTYENQVDLRRENGCPNVMTSPPSSCRVPTAIPGTSNHEQGSAFDFNVGDKSSPQYKWLAANGAKYNLYNLPSEAWHWSTNGK
jgi:hypothetical protein